MRERGQSTVMPDTTPWPNRIAWAGTFDVGLLLGAFARSLIARQSFALSLIARQSFARSLIARQSIAGKGRKLHDIYQKDGPGIAAEGLRRIAHLYKIEASIRGHGPEERLATRQAQSAPMIADFRLWLTHQRGVVRQNDLPDRYLILTRSPKSRLGEKLGYIHRHGDGLQVFLTDGRVEMDTNPVENTIRPIPPNRKNALFAPSRNFGHAKTLPGKGSG